MHGKCNANHLIGCGGELPMRFILGARKSAREVRGRCAEGAWEVRGRCAEGAQKV